MERRELTENFNRAHPNRVILTDLYLAAFLKISGLPILDIDRTHPPKVRFSFPKGAEGKILQFHNGAQVDAIRYASAIEEVKSLIFDIK